jgi:hypothetical protein
MSLTNDSAPSGSEAPAVAEHKAGGTGTISLAEAARSVVDWRRKSGAAEDTQDESAAPATPADESAVKADAAPPQEAPGETEGEPDPAEALPPIEPPRSWTKEEKERFASLPRETQEYLSNRETERDREFRRSQNEAAEIRKAVEAERQRVEHSRLQYEQALTVVHDQLQSVQAGQFSDIKTMEDVNRLAQEDPVRFTQWQAHRMQIGAVQQEIAAAQQRQLEEAQNQLRKFMQTESAKLIEKFPELSDKDAYQKVSNSAVSTLEELGFSRDELGKLWSGEVGISLHDHRLQALLIDGIRYRESTAKQKEAQKTVHEKLKDVPPVQRPGVAQGKNAGRAQELQNLNKQLDGATGLQALRLAARITAARRSG